MLGLGSTPRSTLRNAYHTAMLHDVAGMTVLTARQSPSSEQGLVYTQFYTSEKETFDAAKSFLPRRGFGEPGPRTKGPRKLAEGRRFRKPPAGGA